jgi:biotin-[acetyl-CoA-carboxylase] ligase BirA-like protein
MAETAFRVAHYDTLPSTQDAMRARLEAGEAVDHMVIRADAQTGGRGQRARDWLSDLGGSYQTIAFRDDGARLKRSYAAIAIALGLAEAFGQLGTAVAVKWPNDLYRQHRKVGGILCEYSHDHLLIGVGVNVHNRVPEGAAALGEFALETVHQTVLAGVRLGVEHLWREADIARLFTRYDVLAEAHVCLRVAGALKEGVARGITSDGCLKLETSTGLDIICHHDSRSPIVYRVGGV